MTDERVLIVSADDFGASTGINRGIVEAHDHGVLTSTSLMVHGVAARQAVALAAERPQLAVGLHWDLDGEGDPRVDMDDVAAVRDELACQLEMFADLMGAPPTHIDSHHHVHQIPHIAPVAQALARPLGVPLRGDGRVNFVGGFYAQWEWGVTDLSHVSPEFLIWILRHEVPAGWTEISCHPGYVSDDFDSIYLAEREAELRTLVDPCVREEIARLGIRLASYRDAASITPGP